MPLPAWIMLCRPRLCLFTHLVVVVLTFMYSKPLYCIQLSGVKMPVGIQTAAHHPWGNSRQGGACWSSSPWKGTVTGIQGWVRRGDAVRWEGCTLRDSMTNVSHRFKITECPKEKSPLANWRAFQRCKHKIQLPLPAPGLTTGQEKWPSLKPFTVL